jgi:tetratricopeptide (TPR) repeat protein
MKKKDASFWSDIKTLDERLKREPDSFCFARLSEIYLKVGLVSDALHTARSGVARHPGYVAGQRALALACNESGLHDECRIILEQVTAALPEDVEAQKVLAGLYVTAGDHVSAIKTYCTILDFRPEDTASKIELEALQHGSTTPTHTYSTFVQADSETDDFEDDTDEDEIIELSDNDIFEEPSEVEMNVVKPIVAGVVDAEHHDPLSTLTLAELYEQQGFLIKALAIYRSILADDPTNSKLLAKVAELEGNEPTAESISEETVFEEFDEESDFSESTTYEEVPVSQDAPAFEMLTQEIPVAEPAEFSVSKALEDLPTPIESPFFGPATEKSVEVTAVEFSAPEAFEEVATLLEPRVFAPLANKTADNVVETLDGWLENIRRIKACR